MNGTNRANQYLVDLIAAADKNGWLIEGIRQGDEWPQVTLSAGTVRITIAGRYGLGLIEQIEALGPADAALARVQAP